MQSTATRTHVRTSAEITADRMAATAFFARFEGYQHTDRNPRWRDMRKQVIVRESFDYKLLLAEAECHEWSQRHKNGPKERAAHRTSTRARYAPTEQVQLTLDTTKIRPHASISARTALPAARVTNPLPANKQAKATTQRNRFWDVAINELHTSDDPAAVALRTIEDRETAPFSHWLLVNEHYGAQTPGPAGFDGHIRRAAEPKPLPNYTPGKLTIVGMTPERALAIAVSVAQNAAPAKTKAQLHAAAEARRAEAQERRTDRARQLEANIAAAAQNAARVAADRQLEARQNY